MLDCHFEINCIFLITKKLANALKSIFVIEFILSLEYVVVFHPTGYLLFLVIPFYDISGCLNIDFEKKFYSNII